FAASERAGVENKQRGVRTKLINARLANSRRNFGSLRELRGGGDLAGRDIKCAHAAFVRGNQEPVAGEDGTKRFAAEFLPPDQLAGCTFQSQQLVTSAIDHGHVARAATGQRKRLIGRFVSDETTPDDATRLC